MVQDSVTKAIIQQGLAPEFIQTVREWYQPLAHCIAETTRPPESCLFLGIQGCQGSGKSTLAAFLKIILEERYHLSVATLSLDDFYLTLGERRQLAAEVHPLLITRGVPGTHDVTLAKKILSQLENLGRGEQLALPRFDKACDDRAPDSKWPIVNGPVDIVIFEGWCVGAPPQDDSDLSAAINNLEANEDPDLTWRRYVNSQLRGSYATLFARLHRLIVLNAPSFDCVYAWRSLQEKKLAQNVEDKKRQGAKILSEEELKRFISHYQRLTRHCIDSMPAKADWLLPLNENHQITKLIRNYE